MNGVIITKPPPPSDPANQMGDPTDLRLGNWALAIFCAVAWLGWVSFLLHAGCHGSDVRFGVGRSFNDFSGSSSHSTGKRGHSDGFSFDQDDSTIVSASVGFQISPQTVVIESAPGFTLPSIPAAAVAVFDPTPILALLASIEERLEAIEVETEDHISWAEFGLSSVGGSGGLGLVALAILYLRKYLAEKKKESE